MDEIDAGCLLDENWRGVLDKAAGSDAAWLKRLLAVYSPGQLRQDFRSLFETIAAAGLIGPELDSFLLPPAGAGSIPASPADLQEAYQEAFSLIPATGRLTASQASLKSMRENWAAIVEQLKLAVKNPAILDELEKPWKSIRSGGDLGEVIKKWKEAMEKLRGSLLDAVLFPLYPDICELFRQVQAANEEAKKARWMLTYDDLENKTAQLLQEHPEICAMYNRRIRFVMVDECQDINERQRKIIYLLAGGAADKLRRSSLFVVGDIKQSIYRFRGADNRVFVSVEQDICQSGGQIIELLDNYRSHHKLITAFNEFFAGLMPASVCEGVEVAGLDSIEYQHLNGAKGEPGEEKLEMWVLDADSVSGGDARDKEAEMIAGRIRDIVEGAAPSVQYGDIAILLRAFTCISSYEAALAKAGIPYYVAGGRGFGNRQEVQDAIGLLRFLCSQGNEAALFGVLRSPFFQLSDEALLRLKVQGGAGGIGSGLASAASAGLAPEELATALRAQALLQSWLERRGFLTPAQHLREAFAATGFDLFQLTQFMGVRRFANLQKLLALAESFPKHRQGIWLLF